MRCDAFTSSTSVISCRRPPTGILNEATTATPATAATFRADSPLSVAGVAAVAAPLTFKNGESAADLATEHLTQAVIAQLSPLLPLVASYSVTETKDDADVITDFDGDSSYQFEPGEMDEVRRFHKFDPDTVPLTGPSEFLEESTPATAATLATVYVQPAQSVATVAGVADPPTFRNRVTAHIGADSAAERVAKLDQERNSRDELAKRGYDYEEHNACESCGKPATFVAPGKIPREVWVELRWQALSPEEKHDALPRLREAALEHVRYFCGRECYRTVLPNGVEREKKKSRRRLPCPFCAGPRVTTEPPLDLQGRPTLCTTEGERNLSGCIKYSW